ncbi:hypothetical protein OKW34_000234 [Paraburkholderia youngii]|uniref:hypothetical protein n=1 Tax=Paraburkholderia youngii TaxID=2782701 RepID=UPI003D1FC025
MDSGVATKIIEGVPSAVVTLVIGSIAAYVAYRQYRVNHAKFKLDLFEKRHEIYLYTVEFLTRLANAVEMEPREALVFRGQTAAAIFLFDPDMAQFLNRVADKVFTPREQRRETQVWAAAQLQNLAERFMPYMSLATWR